MIPRCLASRHPFVRARPEHVRTLANARLLRDSRARQWRRGDRLAGCELNASHTAHLRTSASCHMDSIGQSVSAQDITDTAWRSARRWPRNVGRTGPHDRGADRIFRSTRQSRDHAVRRLDLQFDPITGVFTNSVPHPLSVGFRSVPCPLAHRQPSCAETPPTPTRVRYPLRRDHASIG